MLSEINNYSIHPKVINTMFVVSFEQVHLGTVFSLSIKKLFKNFTTLVLKT